MRRYTVEVNGKTYTIDIEELASDRFTVRLGERSYEVTLHSSEDVASSPIMPEVLPLHVEGENTASATAPPTTRRGRPPAPEAMPTLPPSRPPGLPPHANIPEADFRPELIAPMPGTILTTHVEPGDSVQRGQTVLVLEAMKMKNAIKAPQDALVTAVLVQPGQAVGYGHPLVRFERP